jgi:hypothetical protein
MFGLVKTIFCTHEWTRIEVSEDDPTVVIFNRVKCNHCKHEKDEEYGDIPVEKK